MLLAECSVPQIRTHLSNVPRQMTGVSELQEQDRTRGNVCAQPPPRAFPAFSTFLPAPLATPRSQWPLQRAHPAQFQRTWCSWSTGNAHFLCTTILATLQVFPHTPAPGKDAQESPLSDPVALKRCGEQSFFCSESNMSWRVLGMAFSNPLASPVPTKAKGTIIIN